MFNKARNIEVNDSTISIVSGDQNIAENMTIYQNARKRGRQPSPEEFKFKPKAKQDLGRMNTTAGPEIIRPDLKKRKKDDSTVTLSSASNERIYNVGRDAYIAEFLHQNFQGSDASFLSKLHVAKNAGTLGSKVCLKDTRVSLLKRIHEWALNPSGERTLLLAGAAGMGKSAVAHTIARKLRSGGYAIVPFFAFNRSVRESSSQLIPTWMKHVAEHDSKYLNYLRNLTDDQICSVDIVDQYEVLLIDGLISGTENKKPIIFTIDALDECDAVEAKNLLKMLHNLLLPSLTLPSYVRFFFTYRPDPDILAKFSDVSARKICIDKEQDTNNDVYMFL
ncbi:hypothetical protein H0H92_005589 [Tricholoma furcatifolium]|nr:hypothetical protein H0H92_005589 [Tricholoma furcatifolium]